MPLIPRRLMPTRWYELDIDWQLTWAPDPDGADAPIDRPVVFTGTKVMQVPGGAGQAHVAHEVFLVSEQTSFDFSEPYHFNWLAAIDPAANRDGGNTLHLELVLGGPPEKRSVTVPPSTETPFLIDVEGSGEASGTILKFEGVAFTKARRVSVVSSAVAAIRRLFGRLFPW